MRRLPLYLVPLLLLGCFGKRIDAPVVGPNKTAWCNLFLRADAYVTSEVIPNLGAQGTLARLTLDQVRPFILRWCELQASGMPVSAQDLAPYIAKGDRAHVELIEINERRLAAPAAEEPSMTRGKRGVAAAPRVPPTIDPGALVRALRRHEAEATRVMARAR